MEHYKSYRATGDHFALISPHGRVAFSTNQYFVAVDAKLAFPNTKISAWSPEFRCYIPMKGAA